jgi:nucleoside transporter
MRYLAGRMAQDTATLDPRSPAGPSAVNVRLGIMMFLEFFVWGSWYVSTGPYMVAAGMDSQIGNAYSVGPIAAIISPFFLGLIADRFFSSERVLGVMHLLAGAAMFLAPETAGWAFIGILLLHMLCFMPTLGLTNTVAFHHIVNAQKAFPLIRVFGTLGWIVAGIVIWLLGFAESAGQYYVTAAAALALGVYSFTLPHTPPPLKGEQVTLGSVLGLDALHLFRSPSYAVFIGASLLICIPLAVYYSFAAAFASAMGVFGTGEESQVTLYMTLGQISEVGFMLLMPLFFARLGVKWMLGVGMAAWVVRYGLFAGAAESSGSAAYLLILGGIVLHGICYDFFFVTGQIYTDEQSGPRIRGQAQGLLVLVTQGVGMLIGAQLGQRVFNRTVTAGEGWTTFWLYPCAMAGVVMVLFLIFFRERGKGEEVPERGFEPIAPAEYARGPHEGGLPPVDADRR